MLNELIAVDAMCVIILPPAIVGMTPNQEADGRAIKEALVNYRKTHPQLILTSDYPRTIVPTTGGGNPDLFVDGVHQNHIQAIANGQAYASLLAPLIGIPLDLKSVDDAGSIGYDKKIYDPRIGSRYDRFYGPDDTGTQPKTASNDSTQRMVGSWKNRAGNREFPLVTVPSAWTDVTGEVDSGVKKVTVDRAGGTDADTTLTCLSLFRSNSYGYDETFDFSCDGDTASFSIEWTNINTATNPYPFWLNMPTGKYDVSCGLQIEVIGMAQVGGYEHYIELKSGTSGDTAMSRRSENMRSDSCFAPGGNQGPLTSSFYQGKYIEDPCIFPVLNVVNAPTDGTWVFKLQMFKAGRVIVTRWRPTMRGRTQST